MTNTILRHRGFPFVDTGEQWLGAQSDDLLQFIAHDSDDLIVRERSYVLGIHSSKETTQQSAIVRGTMREFIVYESCSEQSLAFTTRD